MRTLDHSDSPLEHPPLRFAHRPFYPETVDLLRCVRDRDFERLSELCDDDFGIVDIDPAGQARPIRSRLEWETWFRELFATLAALDAETDSEILSYQAMQDENLGYSVVEFRQFLSVGDSTATFECIATVVWKRTPEGWRGARWHGSVISSVVPEELRALTNPTD